jgi:predicted transcriptional regulator
LLLGAYVSQNSADNNELEPMLEAVSQNLGQKPKRSWPTEVTSTANYQANPSQGIEADVALSAEAHERRTYDLRCEDKRLTAFENHSQ